MFWKNFRPIFALLLAATQQAHATDHGSHVTLTGTIQQSATTLAIVSSTLLCMDGDGGERIIPLRSIDKKWLGHEVIIEGVIKRSADIVVSVHKVTDKAKWHGAELSNCPETSAMKKQAQEQAKQVKRNMKKWCERHDETWCINIRE
jgi:hypothetical protein